MNTCSKYLFSLSLAFLLGPAAAAVTVERLPGLAQAQAVGSGKLTWWGMTVYQATLFAPAGEYSPDRPHAIAIRYEFSFSREQLARSSVKEIEGMHGEQADRGELLNRFKAVFRDVQEGDQILGVHYPGERAEFYSGTERLGQIDNPELAAAFFSIWLDPSTSEPALRNQLLGAR